MNHTPGMLPFQWFFFYKIKVIFQNFVKIQLQFPGISIEWCDAREPKVSSYDESHLRLEEDGGGTEHFVFW